MTRSRRHAIGGTDAATLLAGATTGDEEAFDALFRRYGPEAWTYASGVSGVEGTARHAVTDGFATTVVMARDGHIDRPGAFRRSLMQATRQRIVEGDDPDSPGHADSSHVLAAPFAALPELHRSVLWLEHVHRLRPNRIAEVTDTAPADVIDLTRRAHHALAVHHLGSLASNADPVCARMMRDSARSLARRLPVNQRMALRSHVSTCADCGLALAPIDDLDSALPALAAAFPEALIDDARSAWATAMTPPTSTGLSPLVERILAATSATAAVIAIVGAAYWRGDTPSQTVAVAPVLNNVGAPVPTVSGWDIDRPLEIPGDTATDAARQATASATAAATTPAPATAPTTQGLSESAPTINADLGDPIADDTAPATTVESSSESGTNDTADQAGTGDAGTGADAPADDAPLLTLSLPLGADTVSVNVGGGDLIETGATADATAGASGSLVDGLTSVVDGLLGL